MSKIKRHPTKQFDCWGLAKELRMDIYRKLAQKASGEKDWLVASGGTEGLIGLPAGLGEDYVSFGGEPYGASTAALGKSIEMMSACEKKDMPEISAGIAEIIWALHSAINIHLAGNTPIPIFIFNFIFAIHMGNGTNRQPNLRTSLILSLILDLCTDGRNGMRPKREKKINLTTY